MGNRQAKQQACCNQYEFPASTAPNVSLPSHNHTRNSNSNQVKLPNLYGAEAAQTGMARVHKVEMRMEDNDGAFSDYINARNSRSVLRPPMLVSRRLHPQQMVFMKQSKKMMNIICLRIC
ncbi:hypothetical protein DVH24_030414 [Malus domestica]|uniref:Uncharacterized protein n=1 Tax=Malus domestica TaxID=3750 RepID=A0A498KTN6_MALDO|nr:hypothetical protein DVH24_030414 [Malus domestica]